MNNPPTASRRSFIKTAGSLAALSAVAGPVLRTAHAAGSNLIQVALVGCGGRGTGAAGDALNTSKLGPIKVVAMADAFEDRLKGSYGGLSRQGKEKVDVPEERRFIGYDGYQKAIDCLKPGDIAIFATPMAFRWVHFQYAIQKGVNVFMEKPLTSDGPTSKRMLKLAEDADAKGIKVGVGLMSRHARPLEELAKHIQDGEIGDIILMRGYRMQGNIGHFASRPKPANITDLEYQVRRFHSFLWAGGGGYSDFNIHIIDHLCWMKGSWPVKVQAVGGRQYQKAPDGTPYVNQNFDTYSAEYTFADGAKMFYDGRCIDGCAGIYASYVHGSKGLGIASRGGDCGGPSSTYKGQNQLKQNEIWSSTGGGNPYQNEWDNLITAIRNNKPYNEAKRGVEGSLVTSMGRMAAHTGLEITFDQMLNCPHEFAPGIDKLTKDSPAPVLPDANGMYPQPRPGQKKTEY